MASAVASSGSNAAAPIFALFRTILRLHRERLPPPMRAMGDTYVKSEFRRHLRSNTSEDQWRTFVIEWQRYAAMLGGTADQLAAVGAAAGGVGTGSATTASVTAAIAGGSADMTEQLLAQLSPDQRRQLIKLQQEAIALGSEMLGKAGPDGGSSSGSNDGSGRQQ